MASNAELRPLLVGQAPGPNTMEDYPLFPYPRTSAGGRLAHFLGLTKAEYLKAFDRCNLLPYFPGQTGSKSKEDRLPIPAARLAARVMRPLLRGRTIVMVGRQVSDAFQLGPLPFLEWTELQMGPRCAATDCSGLAHVAVIPHPSGRNHWYNSELNRLEMRRFMEPLIKKFGETDRIVLPFAANGAMD
jgi:hypothetical protein